MTENKEMVDFEKGKLVNNSVQKFLIAMFDAFNQQSVKYSLVRNFESLPEIVSGDIDIIASVEDLKNIERTILSIAKDKMMLPLKLMPGQRSLSVYLCDINSRDKGLNTVLLHFVTVIKIKSGSNKYLTAKYFLKRTIFSDELNFYIPDDTLHFSTLFFHWAKKPQGHDKQYAERLVNLAREVSIEKGLLCYLSEKAKALLFQNIKNNNRYDVILVVNELIIVLQKHYHIKLVGWQLFWIKSFPVLIVGLPLRIKRILSKKGIIISFSGPDGAGKSTISRLVLAKIKESIPVNIDRFAISHKYILTQLHIRLHETFTRMELSEIKHRSTKTFHKERENLKELLLKVRFRRALGLIFIFIQIIPVWIYYRIKNNLRSGVILFDQSIYEIFIKSFRPDYPIIEAVFLPLLPMPDLLVLMVAAPEEIVARKPELTVNEINNYYNKLDYFIKRSNVPHIRINTTRSIEDCVDLVACKVVELMGGINNYATKS